MATFADYSNNSKLSAEIESVEDSDEDQKYKPGERLKRLLF